MIIKSKSYKHDGAYGTLVNYVLNEKEKEGSFVITKFIKGKRPSREAIIAQFENNERYRLHKRSNNVKLYMDILSFHKDDAKHLTNEVLKKIARKYISLRSDLSLAVATVHRNEKDHVHLHILLSGTAYKTGRSVRISRLDFRDKVKAPAEQFVQKHFPELMKSGIDHKREVRSKARIKDAEYQMSQRGKLSDKQFLIEHLETAFKKAKSEQDFYNILLKENLNLYGANGIYKGVKLSRKYRFKTLGYTKDILRNLDRDLSKSSRIHALKSIRQHQNKHKSKQRDDIERTRGKS